MAKSKIPSAREIARAQDAADRLLAEYEQGERDETAGATAGREALMGQRLEFGGGPGRPLSITELSAEDQIAARQGFQSAAHMAAAHAEVVPGVVEQTATLRRTGPAPITKQNNGALGAQRIEGVATQEQLRGAQAACDEAKRRALGGSR